MDSLSKTSTYCSLTMSVMFVSLLNIIGQLFFPMVIEVLNLLILFIQMYGDLHLILITRVQNGLFHLLMIVLGIHGYFS